MENKFIMSVHYVFHYVLLEQLSYNTRINQTESRMFCENSILYYTTVELYVSV